MGHRLSDSRHRFSTAWNGGEYVRIVIPSRSKPWHTGGKKSGHTAEARKAQRERLGPRLAGAQRSNYKMGMPSHSASARRPVLLFDVLDTLVTEPYFTDSAGLLRH